MDNEKLTAKILEIWGLVSEIKTDTKCLPQLKKELQSIGIEVHDNTQCRMDVEEKMPDIVKNTAFRNNSVKVIFISITAAISGISALILSLIGLKK